jgi:hypothetical protein
MKKFFILICLVFPMFVTGQNWCPNGATWHYSFWNIWIIGYYKIEYTGDTLINSIPCKKLNKKMVLQHVGIPGSNPYTIQIGTEYTYADNDRVYVYKHHQFYTLYDFSAHTGDTWTVPEIKHYEGCDTVGTVRVDSTGIMTIGNQDLRYICVSLADTSQKWGWNAKIVERIGPVITYLYSYPYAYLFPQKFDYCGMNIDEPIEGGAFRCYSDSTPFSYSTNIVPGCDYITAVNPVEKKELSFSVLPNPSHGAFTVIIDEAMNISEIRLTTLQGDLLRSWIIGNQNTLAIENLVSGMYILSAIDKQSRVINKKILSCP